MSRHLLHIVTIVWLLLCLGASPAKAQEWAPFGMSENGDAITLDVSSIVFGGEAASFTMRVDFNDPMAMEGKTVTHLQTPIQINCVKGLYRRAGEEFRTATGEVAAKNPASPWSAIPPSSFGKALLKFCK